MLFLYLFRAWWHSWCKRHGRGKYRPQNRSGELGLTGFYRKPSGNAHQRRIYRRRLDREGKTVYLVDLDSGYLWRREHLGMSLEEIYSILSRLDAQGE